MKPPTFKFEKELRAKGYRCVAGVDEVGRGAWAGPVVAAAVVFAPRSRIWSAPAGQDPGSKLRIRDSKQLSANQRNVLSALIKENCIAFSIAEISVKTINRKGIAKASQRAYRKCLKLLKPPADFILMDAFYIKNVAKKNQKPIIKGDQKSISIAAASIIAKVYRDNLMRKLHDRDPRFSFDQHKGYGTKLHQKLLKKHGLSPHHRVHFVPTNLTTNCPPDYGNESSRR